MKTSHLKLITVLIIIVLFSLFIYFGLNFQKDISETMNWTSGKFNLNTKSKITGCGIILTLLIYLIFKKKISTRNQAE
jgi:ABC-type Fe3+-siderophore transport system permease subunit